MAPSFAPSLHRPLRARRARALIAAALAALALPCAAQATQAVPATGLAIVIKPISQDGKVVALDVREELTGGAPAAGVPLRLHAPLAVFGVASIADQITDLAVSDAAGALPLQADTDPTPAGYDIAYRHWQAARPAVFPVTVRYRIATQPVTEAGGPPYGMKASGQGVAGRGLGFLLLPENTSSTATAVSWDLSDLPAGSVGAITFGAGRAIVPGAPSEVGGQWMLAGPARVFTSTRAPGLETYVLGDPPFDVPATVDWAERSYAYLAKSLKYLDTPPYRLFFRTLDVPARATGSARPEGGGALLTVGSTFGSQPFSEFKNTIFHEMTHQWVGDQSGAGGWFVEGLTSYLSAVLPCEAGLASAQFCADGVNKWASNYYSGVARNWSMAKIDATVGNEAVRIAPYGRGLLYFGLVNAQLLAKSQGKKNVLDVLAPLFVARANGVALDEAAWEAMLLRELGQPAVAEFRAAVIDGVETIVPPSNAFGPCLARTSVRMTLQGSTEQVDGYEWHPIACRSLPAR